MPHWMRERDTGARATAHLALGWAKLVDEGRILSCKPITFRLNSRKALQDGGAVCEPL